MSNDDDRRILSERLREAREYLGFSQEEVAGYLDVPRSALSLMERGRRKVDALELKKLAGLYKRPVGYFTDEGVDEKSFGADIAHLARKASQLSPEDREELVLCSQSLFRFADLGDDGLCRGGPDKGCGVIVSAIDVVVDRLD